MACIDKSCNVKINHILKGCQAVFSPSSSPQAEEKFKLRTGPQSDCRHHEVTTVTSCIFADVDIWQGNKLITAPVRALLRSLDVWRFMVCTLFVSHSHTPRCLFVFFLLCVLPPQDHFFLPAGLLVLQRVPAVSGLCSQAETAAAAAALHHLRLPPPGYLPEAAVGLAATARGPTQQVSRQIR